MTTKTDEQEREQYHRWLHSDKQAICEPDEMNKREGELAFAAFQAALQSQDREDAARLDWLESSEEAHGFCHTGYGEYRHYAHQTKGFKTVREVIDHARRIEGDGE